MEQPRCTPRQLTSCHVVLPYDACAMLLVSRSGPMMIADGPPGKAHQMLTQIGEEWEALQ